MNHNYYTLVASLPSLTHFKQAKELPLTWVQFKKRFKLIDRADMATFEQIQHFLDIYFYASTQKYQKFGYLYNELELRHYPQLQTLFEGFVELKIITVALRAKAFGLAFKSDINHPLIRDIERSWDRVFFGLERRYPYIVELDEALQTQKATEIEEITFEVLYTKANHIAFFDRFSFCGFIAYYVEWTIIQKYLTKDIDSAKEKIKELIGEYEDV